MDDYAKFFRERLTELRLIKGVSEYQMSMDLGMSKGYIQQISSGRTLPRMERFFDMCDYLEISPVEFFTGENKDPSLTKELAAAAQSLDPNRIKALITIADLFK